jgi:hypothetical protein
MESIHKFAHQLQLKAAEHAYVNVLQLHRYLDIDLAIDRELRTMTIRALAFHAYVENQNQTGKPWFEF